MADAVFDAERALAPLKSFQRRTVDYVVQRLFTDPDYVRQFLVADEVGLGKTMVARGVIARAIEQMWDRIERIDIIYICSNGAIAAQNLNRLNVLDRDAQILPTRLTLLPMHLGGERGLRDNKVNFVSLTPGTTFDLKSSTGRADERALILHMLGDLADPVEGAIRLFQVGSGESGWAATRDSIASASTEIDQDIASTFANTVAQDSALLRRMQELAIEFMAEHTTEEQIRRRNSLIAHLRGVLARICASSLEPDLIILDEFQRFPDLLHGDSEAAELARCLFDYANSDGAEARTLLLSATPYRMLTLSEDNEDSGDHHKDFLEVLRFLFGREEGDRIVASIDAEMKRFRRELHALPGSLESARAHKLRLEDNLRRVIARTERISDTDDRNAMLVEPETRLGVQPDDLREAQAIGHIAAAVGAPGIVEYWKSAPYLLNFMRDYKLKNLLQDQSRTASDALCEAVRVSRPYQLSRAAVERYEAVEPHNGRMRALTELAFQHEMAHRLWIPPSFPYQGIQEAATKALVFSSWSMVPDAIAALLSYEAERRMGLADAGRSYFERSQVRPLQFREAEGRLAGLRALSLIYPAPALARAADPLSILKHLGRRPTAAEMHDAVRSALEPLAEEIVRATREGQAAETWDWAGACMLDLRSSQEKVGRWLDARDGFRACGDEEAWTRHVNELSDVAGKGALSGRVDIQDAVDHLTLIALGSPAVCALRALSRIAPDLSLDDNAMLTAAAHIGMGFRTLFNQPETQSLLRAETGGRYWQAILKYCAENDLQAVLDEYVHMLLESEGLLGHSSEFVVKEIAKVVVEALSLRPAQIDVEATRVWGNNLRHDHFRMRGRFAMRLAPHGETEAGEKRTGIVRTAFNSPFRPFVLATTSIGQEGLDFHPYCARVIHWNLPNNPVDLEQREGRVHRYKNHAVRLNVAERQEAALLQSKKPWHDPWQQMFDLALLDDRIDRELAPFWLYDGSNKIERHVYALPFSREAYRLEWLKRSVAVYRLAFGQPRQDDLLAWLRDIGDKLPQEALASLQISLRP